MFFTKGQIAYYIEKATTLSKTFEEQYQELYILDDYLTEDIANDWTVHDIPFLEKIHQHGLVDHKAIEVYEEILQNFEDVSQGKKLYDGTIWTLEGLKQHPFWVGQRILAKKLLDELSKVSI